MYITKGTVSIGYRLFNSEFTAKNFANNLTIGDFSLIYGKVSEFLYKAIGIVTGYAIRKENWEEIMSDKIGKHIMPKMCRIYIKKIREPVLLHRDFEACKF